MILILPQEVHPAGGRFGGRDRPACNWRPGARRRFESFWSSLQKLAHLNDVTPGAAATLLRDHPVGALGDGARLPDLGLSGWHAKRVNALLETFAHLTGEDSALLRAEGTLAGYVLSGAGPTGGMQSRFLCNVVSGENLRFRPECALAGFHSALF